MQTPPFLCQFRADCACKLKREPIRIAGGISLVIAGFLRNCGMRQEFR